MMSDSIEFRIIGDTIGQRANVWRVSKFLFVQ
ncbi:hypothetical protein XBP1_2070073 [Xenorhabdus bovienii str. puntauvense]|uniref:Uncharacterized protein n=2 Tax=Xenorhabdus bovienii TaxID=40576 RepID=A0A0B6XET7_XENBV|nr:hypothetical protein XBP1_2070073 [Xenorhabdus bovienii str. puntauvense]CDM92085.1 protein of unknown function [Xenorhabdus bovienii]